MTNTRRGSAAASAGGTVRQTIVETIEAPRLDGIAISDFVRFKEDRLIYERRIEEKNLEPNFQVQLTTYKDSIESTLLELFALGDWVPVDTVAEITEQHLKDCIAAHAVVDPEEYDLGLIEESLKHLKLERADNEHTLQSRVWELVHEYTKIVRNCGYEAFTDNHPRLAIKHFL